MMIAKSAQRRHPDQIQNATGGTFAALVLEGRGPIVVEFMSYGCTHCRLIEPVMQKVAERVMLKETFFRVNIAVEHDLAASYHIEGTPTLLMFLNGRELSRVEGPRPTEGSVLNAVTRPFES